MIGWMGDGMIRMIDLFTYEFKKKSVAKRKKIALVLI